MLISLPQERLSILRAFDTRFEYLSYCGGGGGGRGELVITDLRTRQRTIVENPGRPGDAVGGAGFASWSPRRWCEWPARIDD